DHPCQTPARSRHRADRGQGESQRERALRGRAMAGGTVRRMPRFVLGRRLIRPLVRRLLPGAPMGGRPGAATSELVVAGSDGAPVPVTDQGQGRAILLLHAGSTNRSSWEGVAAALSGRFRVLRFDRWPYRTDTPPRAAAGAATMAAEV